MLYQNKTKFVESKAASVSVQIISKF